MKRLLWVALLLAVPAPAARAGGVTLEGGPCVPLRAGEAWAEVWAEVHNAGTAEVRGTLEVEFILRSGAGPSSSRQVAIAPGTRKRFSLLLAQSGLWTGSLEFRVRGGDGAVVARTSQAPTWRGARERIVALLSATPPPALLAPFSVSLGAARAFVVLPVEAGKLPEQPEGWSHVSVLIVSGADPGILSEAQGAAIGQWIEQGGQMLCLPGADPAWLGHPLLQSLAPTGSVSDGPPAEALAGALGAAVPARTFRFENAGEPLVPLWGPLVGVHRRGSGRVAVAAFNADDPALRVTEGGRTGTEHLRRVESVGTEILKRLDAASAAAWEHPAERTSARWGTLARLMASGVVRYPPTGLLVLVLVGYILVIGPGCLVVLRRRHRPALAVVVIPLLGIVATAVLLIAGSLLNERVTLGNRLTVLQPMEGGLDARALETVILLSPRRGTSSIDSGEGRVRMLADGRRHGIVDARMGGPDGDRLLWGFETREPAWFAAQGRRRLGPLRVYRREGMLVVENGTEFALESARLVEGGRLLLGRIPAGSRFEKELPSTLPRFWERDPIPEPDRPGYLEEATSRVLDEAGESFREASKMMFVASVAFPSPEFRVDDRQQAFGLDLTVVVVPVEAERR